MLLFCVCQKMKVHLADEDQGKTDKQKDSRQSQHQESVKPHTLCRWLVGGWDLEDRGLQMPQSAPILFTLRLLRVLPLSSIVVLPPIGGGWGESDTQTVIISPLEIDRRLGAFWCTLISVIAYIF